MREDPVRVRVDSHIRVQGGLRGLDVALIADQLTIANPDRERLRREHVRGWQGVPRTIALWRSEEDGTLVLPRGFARRLVGQLGGVDWEDRRVFVPVSYASCPSPSAKGPHQARAFEAIHSAEQGVLQMPPGSGKTVAVLEGIRRSGQRALVIVDKTNIAEQWRERCREFLGFTPGLIGDGVWEEGERITIALQQSLWSRKDALARELPSFWIRFGFVCLDECHHASAETYYDVLQRFPAAWRIGASATPYKSRELRPFIDAVLGETILEAPSDDRVDPEVSVVPTGFRHLFWPTHVLKPSGRCGYKYCTRRGDVHRNNYSEMMSRLVADADRNGMVARRIADSYSQGRSVLVLSKRLAHLRALREIVQHWIGPQDVMMLTGEQKTAERMAVNERAERGSCVIFSTIGDEALDIPRLDSLHLPWPTANPEIVKQQCGRVLRVHPRKLQPEIVDYVDDVGVLRGQHSKRARLYAAEGWAVVYTDKVGGEHGRADVQGVGGRA